MLLIWGLATLSTTAALAAHFLRGGAIGHRFLLVVGLLVYVLLPFFAFGSGIYQDGPGQGLWERSFESMYQHGALALGMVVVLMLAFMLADLVPGPRRRVGFDRPIAPATLWAVFLAIIGLWGWYLFQARELLFTGYLIAYRPDLMGPLANISLTVLLLLLNLCQWRQSRPLLWSLATLLACNSVALLSMGGRLYVASAGVGLGLMYFDRGRGRRPAVRMAGLITALTGVCVLVVVGLLRLGGDIDLPSTGRVLLAEPILTSMSLGTLEDCPIVDWVDMPSNFSSSIFNLLPSGLFPDKEQLQVSLDPGGNCLASPFGATNLGTALLVNFGVVGSMAAVMFFCLLMKFVRGTRGWWLYYYLCSLLPFMLFRDGFLIFNKAFFGTGMLTAAVLVAFSPRRGRAGPAPAPARSLLGPTE